MSSGGASETTVDFELTTISNFSGEEAAKVFEAAEELQTNGVVEAGNGYGAKDLGKINGSSFSSAPTLERTELPSIQRARSPTTLSDQVVFGVQAKAEVWRRVEIGLLVALIVVVWCLLMLPVVIYHLPEDKV